jgi:hypothetical protein
MGFSNVAELSILRSRPLSGLFGGLEKIGFISEPLPGYQKIDGLTLNDIK